MTRPVGFLVLLRILCNRPLPNPMKFIYFLHKVDKCLLSTNSSSTLLLPIWNDRSPVHCGVVVISNSHCCFLGGFGQPRVSFDKHRVDSYFFSPDRVELPWEDVTHTEAHTIPPDAVSFPHRYCGRAVGVASAVTRT